MASAVLVIASFSASEDFVNVQMYFFFLIFSQGKKEWIGKGRMGFVSRNYNLFEKETFERVF